MQTKHFKKLLPLTAVALLILAFLVIELEEPPGPCEIKEGGSGPLTKTQPKRHKEYGEVTDRAQAIRPKYEELFWRQPNVWSAAIGLFEDENGNLLEVPDGEGGCKWMVGFVISVTEKVNQSTLPPEDRIPDIIEGIPVQIIEDPNNRIAY